MKKISTLLIVILLSLCPFLKSQKILQPELNPHRYKTDVIEPDMGLSGIFLETLYEDQYGFFWIGSQYGLDLYDGYAVTRMSDIITDSSRTSMDWIWMVMEDHDGDLWVCSSAGLFRYNRRRNVFEQYLPNPENKDLKDNSVHSVHQDSRGIYWLFTRGGLYSFDKEKNVFKDYKKDSITTDEFYDKNSVVYQYWNPRRFYEDAAGCIWIATYYGLKKYDPVNDRFITFRNEPGNPHSISGDLIGYIAEDSEGNLWISQISLEGPLTGTLNKMSDRDIGIFKRYAHDSSDPKSLVSAYIGPVFNDTRGNLWIGGKNGFSRYDHEKDHFDNYLIPVESMPGDRYFDNDFFGSISEDSKGNIWFIAFLNGIYEFNPSKANIAYYSFNKDSVVRLVPDPWARPVMEDQSGAIWVPGINRITRSEPIIKPFHTTIPEKIGLNSTGNMDVTALYLSEKGELWFSVDGYGLFKSSGFVSGEPFGVRRIGGDLLRPYCFLRDHRGQLWIGSIDNGLGKVDERDNSIKWIPHYLEGTFGGSTSYYVGYLYEDSRNIFWMGTNSRGLNIFHPEKEKFITILHEPGDPASLPGNSCLVINEDRKGYIWFGSFQNGLSKLEVSQGLTDSIHMVFSGKLDRDKLIFRFRNYKNNPVDFHSLSGNNICDMYTDSSGRLWIGTTNGLNLYDDAKDIFYPYYESDGLPDRCIFGILEDDHGNLWLSTRKGICKVSLGEGSGPDLIQTVISYRKEDGLHGDVFMENTCFQSGEGWMIFGGKHGFTAFHPDSIKKNVVVPPVYITDIQINNKSVYSADYALLDTGLFETDQIELSYRENFLAFEYVALNYSNAEQNQYKYRMEGLDEDWVDAGTRRYAEYRDLKPGEYTFRVLGSNDDGVWNEEGTSIGIIINPPWYRTVIAYILYAFFLAIAIYGYIRWRTWRLRQDKKDLEQQVSERTAELQEANTSLEEQKEELEQQKEELQITLDQLKETQAQLIQSEKLAALGGLVAGVAHEINTPVGIGLTAASSLEEETRKMADLYKKDKISRADFKDYLNTANQTAKLILSNMQRTADMVQSFKQVSADQSTEQQRKFFLKAYTEDIIRSLYPRLKLRKVNIDLDIDEKMEMDSFPGAFSQIITNLVMNSLTHGFDEKDTGKIEIKANLDKNNLNLEYSDNGKGISPGHIDKIFEPFFTTNKTIGTGLGMHIVYNLVTQKLNGTIVCESRVNEGTRFKIKIPL